MKTDNYSHILNGLNNAKDRIGSMAGLARIAQVDPTNLTRWMTGKRSPSLKVLAEVLDCIGARVVFPEDVDADFSQDISDKNKEITDLNEALERCNNEKMILLGKIELLKEQLSELRSEYDLIRTKIS